LLLNGVACPSPSTCTVVGQYLDRAHITVALVEHSDGSHWTVQPAPNPPGANSETSLNGVSCPSPSDCTAVGDHQDAIGDDFTLAEHWDGSHWTIQHSPTLNSHAGGTLLGVSCPSPSDCTAVGFYISRTGNGVTLVEHWNGSHWTIQPSANLPGDYYNILNGVACPSPSACTAVGYSFANGSGNDSALIEHWNGAHWTIQHDPAPATTGSLRGVSCPSPSDCTAVGYTGEGNDAPMVEHWNGSHWTIQPSPNPPDGGDLAGVACPSPTACTGVGSTANGSGTGVTLVENRDSSDWTIQPSPNPAGSIPNGSILSGVACPARSDCTAAGYYVNRAGYTYPLIEVRKG
jgi:hypothetical protein